jgi:hypothetical protein
MNRTVTPMNVWTARHTWRIHVPCAILMTVLIALIAPVAASQERMRAGLWEMTTTKAGATINSGTRCMTAEETTANNGDAKRLVTCWKKISPRQAAS